MAKAEGVVMAKEVKCPIGGEECPCLDPSLLPDDVVNACSAIHHHFGLSYASYLVIPRVVLQSMPREWQARFVGMLAELGDAIDWEQVGSYYKVTLLGETGLNYKVTLLGETGHRVHDPLADYDRGRRKLPLKGGS